MSKSDIWYSYTTLPHTNWEKEEGYYDTANFPWTAILEEHFDVIKSEALTFVEEKQFPAYFNKSMTPKKNSWKARGFLFWGYFFRRNYSYFKQSWKAIKQIPGICAFSVSILEPQSAISPHKGDTNSIIRIHLPIKVPKGLPTCGFKVLGESRAWEVGKPILFNDAQEHEAFNHSDERRVVVILDVIHPDYLKYQYEISAKVINGLVWQGITQSYPGIRKYPLLLKKLLWGSVRTIAHIVLRCNRLLRP